MTEREALSKIQEPIYNYFGCDPTYYPNSASYKFCPNCGVKLEWGD